MKRAKSHFSRFANKLAATIGAAQPSILAAEVISTLGTGKKNKKSHAHTHITVTWQELKMDKGGSY